MGDWANEIESGIYVRTLEAGSCEGLFATALRKAKAEGMREAAVMAHNVKFWDDDGKFVCVDFVTTVIELADKLERGDN